MDELSELTQMVEDEAIEESPDNSSLTYSKYAYNLAALIVDLVTGWTIWQLTFWYYGVFWFGAGAVAFYLHQKNWEREGNNDRQKDISIKGIVVSVVSMILMAIVAGGLLIARANGISVNLLWSEIGLIAATVSLFGWHAIQLARYYFLDDDWLINNSIARAKAQARKKVSIIKAAGEVVKANREALNMKNEQYKKHGDRAAVDAAIAKVDKTQARPAFAQDVQRVNPSDNGRQSDPTNRPRQ